MITVKPFKALRPTRDKAYLVATRSYVGYSDQRLEHKLRNNPFTFLHVINPDGKNDSAFGEERFLKVKRKFELFCKERIFKEEDKPSYYIYQQRTPTHVFTGIIGAISVDAIYIDASTARVGIFTTNRLPEYTLDVEGDLRVTGDLIVEGDRVALDVQTLRVEDKVIEIGILNDSTELTDAQADESGISVNSSNGSKDILWKNATNAFTSNVNIDLLGTDKTYKIGGVDKLTNTSLINITSAPDLQLVGTLTEIQIDEININGKTISSTNDMALISSQGIAITGGADINITDAQKITGVGKAISAREAARLSVTESTAGTVTTKEYVDQEIATDPVVFSMDITGMGTGTTLQTALAAYLNDLYPAVTLNSNKIARIHTTSYAGATVQGVDVESAKNNSYIAVDSNGTQNESVVQDISFDAGGASGSVILTPARGLMTYTSNGTAWTYQSTSVYP